MFKVMNLIDLKYNQAFHDISENFLNYLPRGKFEETFEPDEADVFFTFLQKDEDDYNPISRYRLHNNEDVYALAKNLREKPCIIWFDCLNPNIPHNIHRIYPDFVKPIDIPVAPTLLPPHPNKQDYVFHIDERMFYALYRHPRRKNTAVIAKDQFKMFFGDVIRLLDVLDHLHVTGLDELSKQEIRCLSWYYQKVTCSVEDHPVGIRKVLSQFEYMLTLRSHWGMEVMGFEAGFCGCYPIYPDNVFFREMLKDTGVHFFDPNNLIASIQEFFKSDKTWNVYHDKFINRFKASSHLPKFWYNVYEILLKQKDGENEQ